MNNPNTLFPDEAIGSQSIEALLPLENLQSGPPLWQQAGGVQPKPTDRQQPLIKAQPPKKWRTTKTIGIALLIFLIGGVIYWLFGIPWFVVTFLILTSELVLAGYRIKGFTWTGLGEYKHPLDKVQDFQRAKTLWDWLQLFGVIAIPIVVVLVPGWLSTLHNEDIQFVQTQHRNDLQIAQDQQRQATLENYLNQMSELILNNNLNSPKTRGEIRTLARARTLTALLILDPGRKVILIQFLYTSHLIDTSGPIVDLRGADLRNVNLNQANLRGIDLSGTNMSGANLNGAILANADLSNTFLIGADLSSTILSNANLNGAILGNIYLYEYGVKSASLSNADLNGANLSNADLSGVDLVGAKVTIEQLAKAKSLKSAIMPDGSKHP